MSQQHDARSERAVPEGRAAPRGRHRSLWFGPAVLHVVRSAIAPMTRTRGFRRVGPRLLPPVERVLRLVTGGRVQVSGLLVPTLTLHSTGARSGEVRDSILMYTPDGHGRAIVAGTSFARERHPAWTYNLAAHPDAAITVRGRQLRVRARRIDSSQVDAAWRRIERQWPGYRGYERDSGRTVRLFLLQPVKDPEGRADQATSPSP
jgi:deazaflavin-dependent oxidoreductase (nitroreductase family)